MKKILSIGLILFNTILFAQTEQQSIELPDFVITGRQNIDIPFAQKRKPELVSIISKDFLTPQYSPEEFPLLFSSLPIPVHPGIKPFDNYYTGTIKVVAGGYLLPAGIVSLNQNFENYLFNAKIFGSHTKEYDPYSSYNNFGFSLSNELFFSTRSDFLPGSKILFGANYFRDSYRLYASNDPTFLRERNNGTANISITSSYNRWISLEFGLLGNIYLLNESGLKETNLNANGLLEIKLNNFSVGAKGRYINQSLEKNISGNNGGKFYSVEGFVKILPANSLSLNLGVDYSSGNSNTFFSPFALLEFNIDKGLTFTGEYKPHAEFTNYTDLLTRNMYYKPGLVDNIFLKYKTNINFNLKYEYKKIYSVIFSGGYSKIENYFYFEDRIDNGKFDLFLLPDVSLFTAGVQIMVNPNYYGNFVASIKYQNVKDNNGKFVPYEPKLSSSISYGYKFIPSLGIKINYLLELGSYIDIINSNKLSDYHNISFSLYYELLNGLNITADFHNILNQSNFVWKQYKERPFDVVLGTEFRW